MSTLQPYGEPPMPPRPDPKDLAVQLWAHASLSRAYDPVLQEPLPPELDALLRELSPDA